jgi:hypothetical protein
VLSAGAKLSATLRRARQMHITPGPPDPLLPDLPDQTRRLRTHTLVGALPHVHPRVSKGEPRLSMSVLYGSLGERCRLCDLLWWHCTGVGAGKAGNSTDVRHVATPWLERPDQTVSTSEASPFDCCKTSQNVARASAHPRVRVYAREHAGGLTAWTPCIISGRSAPYMWTAWTCHGMGL